MVRLIPCQAHLTGANRPRALTHEVNTSALAERRKCVPVYVQLKLEGLPFLQVASLSVEIAIRIHSCIIGGPQSLFQDDRSRYWFHPTPSPINTVLIRAALRAD